MSERLSAIVGRIAEKAMMDRRSPPVIETDYESAKILAMALCEDIGCRLDDLGSRALNWPYLVQFDGVKISVHRPSAEELYRDHFGPLADIFG